MNTVVMAILAAIFAAMLALSGAVWWLTGENADLRKERDAATGNIETRERIDNATSGPRDPDSILDRLRDLAK